MYFYFLWTVCKLYCTMYNKNKILILSQKFDMSPLHTLLTQIYQSAWTRDHGNHSNILASNLCEIQELVIDRELNYTMYGINVAIATQSVWPVWTPVCCDEEFTQNP